MTGPETVAKAYVIASQAHQFQLYKDGTPKMVHGVRMSLQAPRYDFNCQAAALLHDVVEKSDMYSLDDLRSEGFSEGIVNCIDALTQRTSTGETYDDYINRVVAGGGIAVNTKIRDLWDKLDNLPKIRNILTEKDIEKLKTAQQYWLKLTQIAKDNGWLE